MTLKYENYEFSVRPEIILISIFCTHTSTLSSNPKTIADVPVVKIPLLNNTFGPIRFIKCPYNGDTRNTINSNIPKTNPYSVAVHPFFSAWNQRKRNDDKIVWNKQQNKWSNINVFHCMKGNQFENSKTDNRKKIWEENMICVNGTTKKLYFVHKYTKLWIIIALFCHKAITRK